MAGFNTSRTLQTPNPLFHALMTQPRFLRAIPSLVLLTTALAWGASSPAGGWVLDGGGSRSTSGVSSAAGQSVNAGTHAGVRTGAHGGITAQK